VTDKEIERALAPLRKRLGPRMVGWSNKVRDGTVRIYIAERSPQTAEISQIEIAGQKYGLEYVTVGEIRVL